METVEPAETAHASHARTGIRWLDASLALSVFDECWLAEQARTKAVRTAQCPTDWVSFAE
jgi:hypothetical protein